MHYEALTMAFGIKIHHLCHVTSCIEKYEDVEAPTPWENSHSRANLEQQVKTNLFSYRHMFHVSREQHINSIERLNDTAHLSVLNLNNSTHCSISWVGNSCWTVLACADAEIGGVSVIELFPLMIGFWIDEEWMGTGCAVSFVKLIPILLTDMRPIC